MLVHRHPRDRIPRRSFLGLLAAAGCRPPTPAGVVAPRPTTADLLVHGGTIVTLDAARPRARAVAIADGVIVALDDEAETRASTSTLMFDLRGGTATAGLVDAHAHLVGLGASLEQVDLRGARSVAEVVERLRKHAPPSGWILGRGWDQNLWGEGASMPGHQALTEAFPERPVWLSRVDGHAGWGNAALLREAKIERDVVAPAGGEILRDPNGNPSGVFVDAAMTLVAPPAPDRASLRRQILAAQAHAVARGLTGVHEMGIGPEADAVYRELAESGELHLRIHAYAAQPWFEAALGDRNPDAIEATARYVLAGVKLYADGALGSRGAALLQPYSDRPDHRGLMRMDPAALNAVVDRAVARGWQVATHAIGDAANRAVLDAYAAALAQVSDASDLRLRIEHAQIVDPADIHRFAELGVIASMQPTHATSDMPWVPARIGQDRLAGAYAWQRFLAAGVHLAFGSDFPVELTDVTHGLYAAVTRQTADGQPAGGWLPDQRVSLEQALRSFSSEAAYAAHRDDHLGRIAIGQRGDLSCFADPLMELAPERLRDAKIRATIVDGAVAFEA